MRTRLLSQMPSPGRSAFIHAFSLVRSWLTPKRYPVKAVADEEGIEHECGGKRRYIGLLMHDMRRSAARRLRNNGTHENVIMAIGGWKTRSMFDRYAIVNNDDKRRALEALQEQSAHVSP